MALGVIWKTPVTKFLYYLVKPKVLHLRAVEGGVILCRCALVPKLTKFCQKTKGQEISKQNCRAVTSPKNKRMNLFFYPDDSELLKTWNRNSSFKYFWAFRIEKQICLFIFLGEVMARQFCLEIYWPLLWWK